MKFDPVCWNEVNPNEKVQAAKGVLRVRASAPAPLYIEAEGCEALCGVGTAFDVELSEAVTFRLDAPKGVRVFVHRPLATTVHAAGEVYTNIDRMPDESGSLMEVTRARRQLELERRAMLREIRAERDAVLEAVRGEKSAQPAASAPLAPPPDAAPAASAEGVIQ